MPLPEPMKPASDKLVIGGVALETRWIGPGPAEAPTIVLLHHALGSVHQWGDFPERLVAATGCGAFVYSRAGHGKSDRVSPSHPLSYLHDEALNTLPALLDAIGFERGVLLGHSDGASIATIYAGSIEDQRVRGLVLIAPHFFVEPLSLAGIVDTTRAYEIGPLRERLMRYHGSNVDNVFWGWSRTWLDPGFGSWDIRHSLARITAPLLIVQGSDDEYGTVAQIRAAKDEAHCPVDEAVIPGTRHFPHLEKPQETMAPIADFVSTLLVTCP
jgi:pimeloyl-ACP methyl ester carboxylesterase